MAQKSPSWVVKSFKFLKEILNAKCPNTLHTRVHRLSIVGQHYTYKDSKVIPSGEDIKARATRPCKERRTTKVVGKWELTLYDDGGKTC